MREHNHKENFWMMWAMMIPCLLLLGILFLGGGKLPSPGYLWPILIVVFVVAHIWMMFKGHGGHRDDDTENKSKNADKNPLQDPVCRMRTTDQMTLVYKGQTHAFCSGHCRQQFEKDPEAYIAK